MIIHRGYSQPLWPFRAHKTIFHRIFSRDFPQNIIFPPTRGSVNSPRTAITISRACRTFEYITECCLITFLCSRGDWLWSGTTSCPSLALPRNRSSDLHEQSNSYRSTTICRKPTKLFIHELPDTISERWWYATAVIRWLWSPSSLICQFWPPKHQKMDPFSCLFVFLTRHVATIEISLAYQIINDTTGRALMFFRYILLCLVLLFTIVPFGGRAPRKKCRGDLHKHSDRHQTTTNCRKPAKLFINVSPHIISEEW